MRNQRLVALAFAATVVAGPAGADSTAFEAAFTSADQPATSVAPAPEPRTIGSGMASYYGRKFAGRRTASGDAFDPDGYTAAHRTLPFGSKVRVTNARTGASVTVRINDRGPWHGNRLIDLSDAAARDIGLMSAGSGKVELALLSE